MEYSCILEHQRMEVKGGRPLRVVVEALKGLTTADGLHQGTMDLSAFATASLQMLPLFNCAGTILVYSRTDYERKAKDLIDAVKEFASVESMIDRDVENDTVRSLNSHSRNLLRVIRGLDFIRLFFQEILNQEGSSLKGPFWVAYNAVFSRHHPQYKRNLVNRALIEFFPSKSQLLNRIDEDEASAIAYMKKYVRVSDPVIRAVEGAFLSRDLGIDW